MNKAQNNRIKKGEKIYEEFLKSLTKEFPKMTVGSATPTTSTLEQFALLSKLENMSDVLLVKMMEEYMSNVFFSKLMVDKGRLYEVCETRHPL